MKEPLISVCIPIYDGENFIESTIRSVLNQSFENFELILVNDNSEDKTEEIISNIEDSRIRYFKNETNIGMVNNWNRCIKCAVGKYVKLLCQDDLLSKDCLLKQVQVFEKYENVVLVSGSVNIINEKNDIIMKRRNFKKNCMIKGQKVAKKSLVCGKNLFGEPSVIMFRHKDIDKIGYYNEDFWYIPDWDFSIRCLSVGDFYYIDEYLMNFRLSKTSQTTKIITKNKFDLYQEDKKFVYKYSNDDVYKLRKSEIIYRNFKIHLRTFLKEIFLSYIVKEV